MNSAGARGEREELGEAAADADAASPAFSEGGAEAAAGRGGAAPLPSPATGGGSQVGGGPGHDAAAKHNPSNAVKRLLPGSKIAECALLWVEGRNAKWQEDKAVFKEQMRPAAAWALQALCHAHEDPRLKKAVHRLLAVRYFTANLDSSEIKMLFTKTLRPGLRARLVELGASLKAAFDDAELARRLSDDAVAEAVGRPQKHPLALERKRNGVKGRPTQIDLLPSVDAFVDFSKPETFPDEVYAHAVLTVAAALDASFQAAVAAAMREHNAAWERDTGTPGTAKHSAAPTKAVARVGTKVQSDYRHEAAPRAQHNVDVARCLVTADTPEELLALSGRLTKTTFRGVVRVKNLFSASEAERAERFHLLPLMLTVTVGAGGDTYGEFVQRPEVTAAFDAYVAARDVTVPPHRWRETTSLARAMLESGELSGVQVRLLGELQMVLTEDANVRHAMHEVYKAFRAESAQLLWEDYARTAMGKGEGGGLEDELAKEPETLGEAAKRGNRPAVEAFLKREGVDVNAVVDGFSALGVAALKGFTDVVKVLAEDGRVDINLRDPSDGATPLWMAAFDGRTDVARLLLEHRADANQARADDGRTPLYAAAGNSYTDVVRLLLEHRADANQAMTDDGITPLHMAAQNGHTNVVRVLLEHRADANHARTATGSTPLFIAAHNGHTDVAQMLLKHSADVNLAKTNTGTTPLSLAALKGHTDVARLLLEHRADANLARTTDGVTPLHWATYKGHTDIVRVLLEHRADVNQANSRGASPLTTAWLRGHTEIARMLIEAGTNWLKAALPLIAVALLLCAALVLLVWLALFALSLMLWLVGPDWESLVDVPLISA